MVVCIIESHWLFVMWLVSWLFVMVVWLFVTVGWLVGWL